MNQSMNYSWVAYLRIMKKFSNNSIVSATGLKVGLIILSLISVLSQADAEIIDLNSGQEISLETFGSPTAEFTLLWIHSERGAVPNLKKTLKAIAEEKSVQIILPDFHESYFIPVTRSSLNKIPQDDIEEYISTVATKVKPKKLFVFSMSRSAGIVLKAAQNLQLKKNNPIAGIVLLAPYLQVETPEIGKSARYQTVTSQSNLPLYLIQAERSPRFIPLPKIVKKLQEGGSPLFIHILKDVHGGFQQRDSADLRDKDIEALKAFPSTVYNALKMLDDTRPAPFELISKTTKQVAKKKSHNGLQEVSIKTPSLQMNDLQSRPHKLSDYKGKVVIVSFWASWCRPCLEEMPSLVALKNSYPNKLEILGVNIREDKDIIQHFTKEMAINFPLLQDKTSKGVKDWKVYVYPSNFIVDKKGKIRYAATGAMDWQEDDIKTILESLLDES